MIARLIAGLAGLLYLGLGAWVLLQPDTVAETIGLGFHGPAGRLEFLVAYGGFYLGVGAFLGLGMIARSYTVPALWLFVLTSIGVAAVRGPLLMEMPDPPSIAVQLLWAEVAMIAAGVIGLIAARNRR